MAHDRGTAQRKCSCSGSPIDGSASRIGTKLIPIGDGRGDRIRTRDPYVPKGAIRRETIAQPGQGIGASPSMADDGLRTTDDGVMG